MNARADFQGSDAGTPLRRPGAPRPVLTLTDASHPYPGLFRTALPQNELPVHDARRLTGVAGQAQIVLDGQVYALRTTRAGKLILTK